MHLDRTTRRVLGSLVEKRMSTPEQYPLTLNTVVLACNQKSNREPAMDLPEFLVEGCLKQLRVDGWVTVVERDFGRAVRYAERMTEQLGLSAREAAILAELLLRGPQTEQELHRRCERMVKMASPEEVVGVLQMMASRRLVEHVARGSGQRIARWRHLLTPPEEEPAEPERTAWAPAADPAPTASTRWQAPPTAPTPSPGGDLDPVSNPHMPACAGSSAPGLMGWAGPNGDLHAPPAVPLPPGPTATSTAPAPAPASHASQPAVGARSPAGSAVPSAYGSSPAPWAPAPSPSSPSSASSAPSRQVSPSASQASSSPGSATPGASPGFPGTSPAASPAAAAPTATTIAAARSHYAGTSSPAPSLAIPDDPAALRAEVIALRAEVARLRARISELTGRASMG